MNIWEDYYYILQVHHSAEQEVIEGAYRRLCKKYHPDINQNPQTNDKIKQINAAYEVLKDNKKRKKYHNQWLNNNKEEKNINEKKWKNGFTITMDDEAQRILSAYIRELSNKKFTKAYNRLSEYNKSKVSKEDFVKWQEAVAKLYVIGHFKTKVFNTYSDIILKRVSYKKAIEFEIRASEKNVITGKITKYQFTKTIIKENGQWKILLEYDDLKLLIHKFKYLYYVNTQPSEVEQIAKVNVNKNELTGLLNKRGLMEELEREKNRFLRYKNIFSISILSLRFSSKEGVVFRRKNMIKYMAYTIQQYTRNTDIVANITYESFAIIFTETNQEKAKIATKRIIAILKDNFRAYYNHEIDIRTGIFEHSGRNVKETLKTACYLAGVETKEQNEAYEDIKLNM